MPVLKGICEAITPPFAIGVKNVRPPAFFCPITSRTGVRRRRTCDDGAVTEREHDQRVTRKWSERLRGAVRAAPDITTRAWTWPLWSPLAPEAVPAVFSSVPGSLFPAAGHDALCHGLAAPDPAVFRRLAVWHCCCSNDRPIWIESQADLAKPVGSVTRRSGAFGPPRATRRIRTCGHCGGDSPSAAW